MSLSPPESVQKLQNALHAKAKGSPTYRFYALYDKVYRADVLAHAYACCKANQGAAGVDGQRFEDIETYGLERWLGELQQALKDKSYRPSAVRRVWIPKPDGKQRPLGIPTIKDRVAQMAAVLVLEPIFETDLLPEQYAYRPQRSALDAVSHVQTLSSLYMRRFVLGWKSLGHERRLKAFVVNYADDLVICCRGRADQALAAMREVMSRLKLTVNETKTRVCRLPQGKAEPPYETFDFLGYTFGRLWSPRTGRPYLGVCPSKKRIQRFCAEVTKATDRRITFRSVEEVVAYLNPMVQGWANYFSLGSVSKAYRIVDAHVGGRLRKWLNAKHKVRCAGRRWYVSAAEARQFGLTQLRGRKGSLPWANA
jgi:Group II intron, maturase-specific domain/Reverse transcriptase (RNA-dependent DNA polymerase)